MILSKKRVTSCCVQSVFDTATIDDMGCWESSWVKLYLPTEFWGRQRTGSTGRHLDTDHTTSRSQHLEACTAVKRAQSEVQIVQCMSCRGISNFINNVSLSYKCQSKHASMLMMCMSCFSFIPTRVYWIWTQLLQLGKYEKVQLGKYIGSHRHKWSGDHSRWRCLQLVLWLLGKQRWWSI